MIQAYGEGVVKMPFMDNQIMAMFSWDLFRQVASGAEMSPCKVNMLTAMLVGNGIPYDLSFDAGNRKEAPAMELTIHLSPVATLVFAIGLAPGSNVYSASL